MRRDVVFIDFPLRHRQRVESLIAAWHKRRIVSASLTRSLQLVLEYGTVALFDGVYGERPVASYLPGAHRVVLYEHFFRLPKKQQDHISLHELIVHPLLELFREAGHINPEEWSKLDRLAIHQTRTSDLPYVAKLVRRYHDPKEVQRLAILEGVSFEQYKSRLRELIVLEIVAERMTIWLLSGRQEHRLPYSDFFKKHFSQDRTIVSLLGKILPAKGSL